MTMIARRSQRCGEDMALRQSGFCTGLGLSREPSLPVGRRVRTLAQMAPRAGATTFPLGCVIAEVQ